MSHSPMHVTRSALDPNILVEEERLLRSLDVGSSTRVARIDVIWSVAEVPVDFSEVSRCRISKLLQSDPINPIRCSPVHPADLVSASPGVRDDQNWGRTSTSLVCS